LPNSFARRTLSEENIICVFQSPAKTLLES
jgi:hypothetical protein